MRRFSQNSRLFRVLVISHIVGPLFCIADALIFVIFHYTFLALSSATFCFIRLCNIPSIAFVVSGFIDGVLCLYLVLPQYWISAFMLCELGYLTTASVTT